MPDDRTPLNPQNQLAPVPEYSPSPPPSDVPTPNVNYQDMTPYPDMYPTEKIMSPPSNQQGAPPNYYPLMPGAPEGGFAQTAPPPAYAPIGEGHVPLEVGFLSSHFEIFDQ